MSERSWIDKLSKSLTSHIGKAAAGGLLTGCENLEQLGERERADCAVRLMARLDQQISDQQIRSDVMTACACNCYAEHIEVFKEGYRENGDIDRLLDLMHGRVFLNRPVREGNIVFVTKAPCFPEEHAKAHTPAEKRYYYCHCDNVRAVVGRISPTYCLCGAGWCRNIWESVLERPVQMEVVKSVLQGDETCQFAVHLPQ